MRCKKDAYTKLSSQVLVAGFWCSDTRTVRIDLPILSRAWDRRLPLIVEEARFIELSIIVILPTCDPSSHLRKFAGAERIIDLIGV